MTATRKAPKTDRQPRRAAAASTAATAATAEPDKTAKKPSKLDLVVAQLARPEGASLAELVAATGWQAHSVRGALAGALKKKGHAITSDKVDGERRYRVGEPK